MCVGNVVDHMVDERAERAVYRAERPPKPIPLPLAEMRQEYVGMLKVRDEDEVEISHHVGHDVVLRHGQKAEYVDRVTQSSQGCKEAKV